MNSFHRLLTFHELCGNLVAKLNKLILRMGQLFRVALQNKFFALFEQFGIVVAGTQLGMLRQKDIQNAKAMSMCVECF